MANIIKLKRGLSTNIGSASLEQGELAITTDTNELYVGKEGGTIEKINMGGNQQEYNNEAFVGGLPTCTITNGNNGFEHSDTSADFTAFSADGMVYETTLTITQENISAMGFLVTITSPKKSATSGECILIIENTTKNEILVQTSEIGEIQTLKGLYSGDSIKLTFACPERVNVPMEVTVSVLMHLVQETNNIENVLYSQMMIEDFATDCKISELKNKINHVRAGLKPQVFGGTIPNLDLNLTAEHDNCEFRIYQGSQGTCTLTIGLQNLIIEDDGVFRCKVILKTPYRNSATTAFSWADDYSGLINITGDDVVDGVFTPQLLKVYEMEFNWNGFMMNCVVKGNRYTPPAE